MNLFNSVLILRILAYMRQLKYVHLFHNIYLWLNLPKEIAWHIFPIDLAGEMPHQG